MNALVTGGGGFIGSRVARLLDERGDSVTVLGRRRYRELEELGVRTIQADIRDAPAMIGACRGMDVVFHVAALASIWGPRKDFWTINVDGTRNILEACRAGGVGRLVFTSTPSVVFGATRRRSADGAWDYPDRFLAHYPETKAVAERMVLQANSATLATTAIRPHLVWGPGDPHLIPRVLERAASGKLVQVGDGTNLVYITYIDNAATAHVQAADALSPGGSCAGRAFFVSQGEPVALWPWLGEILEALDLPRVQRTMSFKTAYWLGALSELSSRLLGLRREPPMTRFLAAQLSQSPYSDVTAARDAFGYEPLVSTADGFERMIEYFKHRLTESS